MRDANRPDNARNTIIGGIEIKKLKIKQVLAILQPLGISLLDQYGKIFSKILKYVITLPRKNQIPKSSLVRPLAIRVVKINPKRNERTFPMKSINPLALTLKSYSLKRNRPIF